MDVLNRYEDSTTAPPHQLKLKLNAVAKPDKMATNTRVRVVGVSANLIRVCTLDAVNPRHAWLPRFVFTMKSFRMGFVFAVREIIPHHPTPVSSTIGVFPDNQSISRTNTPACGCRLDASLLRTRAFECSIVMCPSR